MVGREDSEIKHDAELTWCIDSNKASIVSKLSSIQNIN